MNMILFSQKRFCIQLTSSRNKWIFAEVFCFLFCWQTNKIASHLIFWYNWHTFHWTCESQLNSNEQNNKTNKKKLVNKKIPKKKKSQNKNQILKRSNFQTPIKVQNQPVMDALMMIIAVSQSTNSNIPSCSNLCFHKNNSFFFS